MDIEPLLKLLAAITPLIQAIAWPVLFLYLVFHFNNDIKEFFKNLNKFSIKAGATGIEASGERSIESAAFIGAAIAKRTPSSEPISDESVISGIAKKISDATVTKDISNASVLWVDDSPSNNVLEIKSLKALGIKFSISTSTGRVCL